MRSTYATPSSIATERRGWLQRRSPTAVKRAGIRPVRLSGAREGDSGVNAAFLQSLRRPPVELEVIIPAFNEEVRLPSTIESTVAHLTSREWSAAIVVVDNDSVDRTAETIDQFHSPTVKVYRIGCSERGKGAAVRRGILTSSARYIGFIDADNATPIATLDDAMVLLKAGYDAVVASRRMSGARYAVEQSRLRRGGAWLFHRLAYLTVPSISDSQCGFKFFDGSVAREVAAHCRIDGYVFDLEMLARMAESGRPVVEVPVTWSDVAGSKFSIRRDGFRCIADLVQITMSAGR
jgi:dolichyl-phosphate beta-glucosyltransferase